MNSDLYRKILAERYERPVVPPPAAVPWYQQDAYLLRLHRRYGWTVRQIAATTRLAADHVRKVLARHGCKVRREDGSATA
ncbi:hypothetical protein [Micromonospora carbonacea]|uniref:Helix-turn-helix domain-containing protein n=1 Tax=Micromonospora carbonacea TaxID=47853 RepID=A0A1C4WX84_9ACTN|nr:hypothetical protein [Micromonospora carbonacea]SCF00800.1 hypothetical protein GA0070563_10493 [Micromonospora carbonacea]